MIRYNKFVNESLQKKPKKPTRPDLAVGTMVRTMGQWDGIDINNQLGTIIEMKEYGHFLIDFILAFSPRLHSGHKDRGTPGHCFYLPLDNIYEIIPDELAEKIKSKTVVPYKASTDLLRIFRRMKFEPTEEYLDISFFDVDRDNIDVISYLPAKKFEGDPDTKKGRQSMKVGRILKKLDPTINEKALEDLVITYRASYKIIILGEGKNLDVVTGEDIRYWYSNEHYAKSQYGSSELWNSCMSSPGTAPIFNLYCENPDKIALCTYTNEDDKLLARAIVWRLDDGSVYMDRVYAVSAEEKKLLTDYAAKNGMKSHNKGERGRMEVTLPKEYGQKHRPPHGNPYMDTMRYACVDADGKRYFLSNMAPAGKGQTYHGT